MKMIIAINNKVISTKLQEYYKSKFDIYVLNTKELVLNCIKDTSSCVLVTRYDIKGEQSFNEYINAIRQNSIDTKIVVIVRELTQKIKEELFAKEIFNIIEGKKFEFEELIENIETPKMIIYKNKREKENKSNIVIVTGFSSSGKTTVAKVIAQKIAKSKKVLLIDMDFITPTLDLYVSGVINYSLVDYIKDIMENNVKSTQSYETKDIKNSKLSYILNSESIGIPKEKIIIDIISNVVSKYDFIVVDTSSIMINQMYEIARKINATVVYVIEPSVRALRLFQIHTNSIALKALLDTKFIMNKCRNSKKVINEIVEKSHIQVYGKIRNSRFKNCNLSVLLKEIGVIKYAKIKNRIISKLINLEEE